MLPEHDNWSESLSILSKQVDTSLHEPVKAAWEPELKGDKCNHPYKKKISVYI